MKIKSVEEIKYGSRVLPLLTQPVLFSEIVCRSSLDKMTVQKVLADLQKYGYISKTERSLWVATDPGAYVEETNTY